MTKSQTAIINYSNVFFNFYANDETHCVEKATSHLLMYIYSGEMLIQQRGIEDQVIKAGECFFVRKDHRVVFTKRPSETGQFNCITIWLKRNLLRDYYRKMEKDSIPATASPFENSVLILTHTSSIKSLFLSMLPYFEEKTAPIKELIDLKMQEAVISLLKIDKCFYPTLFDFTEPWKIDILDFLNENYTDDLTMEEITAYTGRSLATFKRDFKKISTLSPQKWLIRKRLQKAYELIKEGQKVTDVCFDVGFKNRSHFSMAFKKEYGFSPANVYKSQFYSLKKTI